MHTDTPTSTQNENNPRLAAFAICAMLLPMCVFYGVLALHAVNIPYADDYDAVLGFLEHFSRLSGVLTKLIYIISAQHNEYKPMFAHLIFVLQYKIFGHPNFVGLSWLGNIFILPLFYLIWRSFLPGEGSLSHKLMFFVPVSFLLFQLQYSETLDWSMPGLQNITILVFALACIVFLSRDSSWRFFLACIFLVLSVASSGNGFALVPIGIIMFLGKKKGSRIAVWIILSGLCAIVYFRHYNFLSSQQAHSESVLNSIHYLNPVFTLSFMGSALGNTATLIKYSSVVLGIAICIVIVYMVKRRYYRLNPTIFYYMSFLVLTAIAVSGIRSRLGFDQSHAGRYKIYSDLLLICCYVFIVETRTKNTSYLRHHLFQVALVLSVLFCALFDWAGNKHLTTRQSDLVTGVKLYKLSNHQQGPFMGTRDDTTVDPLRIPLVHNMLQDAESTGLYRFP